MLDSEESEEDIDMYELANNYNLLPSFVKDLLKPSTDLNEIKALNRRLEQDQEEINTEEVNGEEEELSGEEELSDEEKEVNGEEEELSSEEELSGEEDEDLYSEDDLSSEEELEESDEEEELFHERKPYERRKSQKIRIITPRGVVYRNRRKNL